MKQNGIVIYTIALGQTALNTSVLRQCATSSNDFFEAPGTLPLAMAFREIIRQLSTLRISQ